MKYKLWLYSLPIRYRSWHPYLIEFRLWPSWFFLYSTNFDILFCHTVQTLAFTHPAHWVQTLATAFIALQFIIWHHTLFPLWSSDSGIQISSFALYGLDYGILIHFSHGVQILETFNVVLKFILWHYILFSLIEFRLWKSVPLPLF